MTPAEIKALYDADLPVLAAWGRAISDAINNQFKPLLKMEATFRIKSLDSLTEKALHRNKGYGDPYRDITDKVGVRAVVLLEDHVKLITTWIRANTDWDASLDRDFEAERQKDPLIFNYQSNHLILRPKASLRCGEVEVPAGTACELQIRTLLQHAYSELSHDLIYKPKLLVQPSVRRMAARSMALIETTDGVFIQVHKSIVEQEAPLEAISALAAEHLKAHGIVDWNQRVNQVILDGLRDLLRNVPIEDMRRFLGEKVFIMDHLREWKDDHPVYSTPAILPAMYLISTRPNDLADAWPYTPDELDRLFTALGRTPPAR